MLLRIRIVRFLLALLSAGTLSGWPAASEVVLPAPCDAYLENLEAALTGLSQEDFDKCGIHEQVIISAESWSDFVLKFEDHIGSETLPVRLFDMFAKESEMNYARAFAGADLALSQTFEIFLHVEDYDRAEFYSSLLIEWRNELLVKAKLPDVFTSNLARSYIRSYEFYGNFSRIDKGQAIKCAIRFDSFLLPLREFLKSKTFEKCVQHNL